MLFSTYYHYFCFSPLSLGPNNLLLRGAMLRNTSWVCSVVIYTGHETKLMMNQTSAPLKRSTVDKIVNTQIIMLFLLLCSLCLISSFCNIIWTKQKGNQYWYLQIDGVLNFINHIFVDIQCVTLILFYLQKLLLTNFYLICLHSSYYSTI